MAKHLTDRDIEKVVGLLIGWKGALSWEALASACERHIGRVPSRQTLARSSRIELAFKTAKDRLKFVPDPSGTSPPTSIVLVQQRVARLEAEITQLKAENRALLEQFVTWQYNAYRMGVSRDELNKALPGIDLRPTNKIAVRKGAG
jgi:hypothetical protein